MAKRRRGLGTWVAVVVTAVATAAGFYLIATRDPADVKSSRSRFGLPEMFDGDAAPDGGRDAPAGAPTLRAVSPRLVSNQASYPLLVFGTGFADGDVVVAEGPDGDATRELPTAFVDAEHLTARLPAALPLPTQRTFGVVSIAVRHADGERSEREVELTLVNDATFAIPYALATSGDGSRVFVASPTTDAVWWVDAPSTGAPSAPRAIPVGDGPRALARWTDAAGREWLVVAHGLEATLWMLPMDRPEAPARVLPVDTAAIEDVAIGAGADAAAVAYVSARGDDAVHAVRLADGEELGRFRVGTNPGPLAVGESRGSGSPRPLVMTSNAGSDDVSAVYLPESEGGEATTVTLGTGPGARILGGHTERYASWVMGGKAPRDLVAYDVPRGRRSVFFGASIGPNVGPNPDRMEVSMNGGVTVYPADGPPTHVSIGEGVPVALALGSDVLFVADIGRGRVLAYDARALATGGDEARRRAQLAALALAPPPGTLRLRPDRELGVEGRAGPSLHSGPWALALSRDGARLYVLERFTGHVAEVDVTGARRGRLELRRSFPVVPARAQPQRRLGDIAYYTDVGGSRMTCDTCHVEGREGGVLFTKGQPMHIYRAPSLLSIGESPPYFTPAMIPTLEATAEIVLSRNRFHNPDASPLEIRALGMYQAALVAPPNPYRGERGELVEALELPAGGTGSAIAGLEAFEGAGACTGCHPAPAFTTDQPPESRGRVYDVGTPITLPLRPEMQDDAPYPLPAPTLVGLWDRFPLLHSGVGGMGVVEDERVEATHPDAIGRVLELGADAGDAHGALGALSPEARRDLAAFLRSL